MASRVHNPNRGRFNRRGVAVLIIALLLALVAADLNGQLLHRRVDDMAAYHGRRAVITRVIDGDTVEIDRPDALHQRTATRVALWGVRCPQPARGQTPAQPGAAEAAALTEHLARGATVTLWLESHQPRDPFGRVLAHLELPTGLTLNEALLEAGLAQADERWPHTMLTRYAQLETQAKRKGVGLWAAKR